MTPAKSFRDLNVYADARVAAARIFEITKRIPRDESFSLTDQIRRSSRAVPAMIAEAWARRRYKAAFINKTDEALGEAYETKSWLDASRDSGYLQAAEFEDLDRSYTGICRMLSRMIDRADDFCKFAPDTDYRRIPKRG